MIDKEKYFKVFISDMAEEHGGNVSLCGLVLSSDLIDYMEEELSLKKMIEKQEKSFTITVNKNASNSSSIYIIDVDRSFGKLDKYNITVENNEANSKEMYIYYKYGPELEKMRCKYCFIKKNPYGFCIMYMFYYNDKNEVNIIKYYNNETLEYIGDLTMDPYSLLKAGSFGIEDDLKMNGNIKFLSLSAAYQYFLECSSELLSKETTLELKNRGE